MILLYTNAVIWLDRAHPRSRPLLRLTAQLRGWRVATGDAVLARALGPRRTLEI